MFQKKPKIKIGVVTYRPSTCKISHEDLIDNMWFTFAWRGYGIIRFSERKMYHLYAIEIDVIMRFIGKAKARKAYKNKEYVSENDSHNKGNESQE